MLSFKQRKNLEAAEVAYEQKTEDDCKEFAEFLLKQWPCQDPTVEGFPSPTTINLVQAMEIIRPEWDRLFQNLELSRHIEQVQVVLNQHHGEAKIEQPVPSVENQETFPTRVRGGEFPSLSADLLRKSGPVLPKQLTDAPNEGGKSVTNKYSNNLLAALPNGSTTRNLQDPIKVIHSKPTVSTVSREFQELQNIIKGISTSHSAVRRQYGQDLMQSLNALITLKSVTKQDLPPIKPERLSADMSDAQQATKEQFNRICKALEQDDPRVQWLQEGGLWPQTTPVTLLEQLRSTSPSTFGKGMKESFLVYALSITTLQRLLRMEDARQKGNIRALVKNKRIQVILTGTLCDIRIGFFWKLMPIFSSEKTKSTLH